MGVPPSVSWSVPTSVVMGRVYGCGCRCPLAAAVRALPDEHITQRLRHLSLSHRPDERSRSEHQTTQTLRLHYFCQGFTHSNQTVFPPPDLGPTPHLSTTASSSASPRP